MFDKKNEDSLEEIRRMLREVTSGIDRYKTQTVDIDKTFKRIDIEMKGYGFKCSH